jgi:hypothetical protein
MFRHLTKHGNLSATRKVSSIVVREPERHYLTGWNLSGKFDNPDGVEARATRRSDSNMMRFPRKKRNWIFNKKNRHASTFNAKGLRYG